MIEINERDISTIFNNGYISQYIVVYNGGVKLCVYYASLADNIKDAAINRTEMINVIKSDLEGKYEVKINLSK